MIYSRERHLYHYFCSHIPFASIPFASFVFVSDQPSSSILYRGHHNSSMSLYVGNLAYETSWQGRVSRIMCVLLEISTRCAS